MPQTVHGDVRIATYALWHARRADRVQTKIGWTYLTMSLIKCGAFMFFLTHLMACLWGCGSEILQGPVPSHNDQRDARPQQPQPQRRRSVASVTPSRQVEEDGRGAWRGKATPASLPPVLPPGQAHGRRTSGHVD